LSRTTPRRVAEIGRLLTSPRKALVAVCAYNESRALATLLPLLAQRDVLVVDDGSSDGTRKIIDQSGALHIVHATRMGKSVSLQDIIDYAKGKDYDYVVEIDADALPSQNAIPEVLKALDADGVGGVSIKQLPVGPKNVAYFIDELIWAVLNHGKSIQAARTGTCHPGGVLCAFKTKYITRVAGAINDDEQLGMLIRLHGQRIAFVTKTTAFFDASSSIGHILERRRRMIVGHYVYRRSSAPGMQHRVAAEAVVRAILEIPRRIAWVVPALVIEGVSRARAFKDARRPENLKRYTTWVTTHRKNIARMTEDQVGRPQPAGPRSMAIRALKEGQVHDRSS
jgi:glycosyltransferase involved in cell wall biosynthesis